MGITKNEILYKELSLNHGERLSETTFLGVGEGGTTITPSVDIGGGCARTGRERVVPHLTLSNGLINAIKTNALLGSPFSRFGNGEQNPLSDIACFGRTLENTLQMLVHTNKEDASTRKRLGERALIGEFTEPTRYIRIGGFSQGVLLVAVDNEQIDTCYCLGVVPQIAWEVIECFRLGKIFMQCANCGDFFTRRYRQHSSHCDRCTNLSRVPVEALSPQEHQQRKDARNAQMKVYRESLKKRTKSRSRPKPRK